MLVVHFGKQLISHFGDRYKSLKEHIDHLMKNDIIEPISNSPYLSSTLMVSKRF